MGEFSPAFKAQIGTGRPKGATNRITASVKEAIMAAFDDPRVGGVEYLVRMANAEPKAFMTLLGKIIPTTLQATVRDETDGQKVVSTDRELAMKTLQLLAGALQQQGLDVPEPGAMIDVTPSGPETDRDNTEPPPRRRRGKPQGDRTDE